MYSGQPFRAALRDLGLTSNQVWGLTKTDDDWSAALEATLTATRRGDLEHGTSAAYAHGCVCNECRAHQRRRMTGGVTLHTAAAWRTVVTAPARLTSRTLAGSPLSMP